MCLTVAFRLYLIPILRLCSGSRELYIKVGRPHGRIPTLRRRASALRAELQLCYANVNTRLGRIGEPSIRLHNLEGYFLAV